MPQPRFDRQFHSGSNVLEQKEEEEEWILGLSINEKKRNREWTITPLKQQALLCNFSFIAIAIFPWIEQYLSIGRRSEFTQKKKKKKKLGGQLEKFTLPHVWW